MKPVLGWAGLGKGEELKRGRGGSGSQLKFWVIVGRYHGFFSQLPHL